MVGLCPTVTAHESAGKRLAVLITQRACSCSDHQAFACLCMRGRGQKLVAIQTVARPALRSTQPATALHVLCVINTTIHSHGAPTGTQGYPSTQGWLL